MSDKIQKNIRGVYEFAALSGYSWRERFSIRFIDYFFYVLISLIGKTIRFEIEGVEHFEVVEKAGKIPIYAFWHNRIFLATYYFKNCGIVVITSQSFDGEYIARFIQRFGYGAVRGSSTRGGVGALVEMIRLMKQNVPMGFTVDGPKGPRYIAKTGVILLAKKTGNPVLPFVVETKNFWMINSWDKLQIPKPFSKAKVFVAQPTFVANNANDEEIENKRRELQTKLDELVRLAKQWRENKV
jgi:lysophospholipid acyltransferase (LPLAT)-like uncharacterized protein